MIRNASRIIRNYSLMLMPLLVVSCVKDERWVFSTDRKDRPITSCIKMGKDGFFGAAMAMNCQKSIIEHIKICSLGRTLQYFYEEKKCLEVNEGHQTLNGAYSLATDSDAN